MEQVSFSFLAQIEQNGKTHFLPIDFTADRNVTAVQITNLVRQAIIDAIGGTFVMKNVSLLKCI